MMKILFNLLFIGVLMVIAIGCCHELKAATTEIAVIKAGVHALMSSVFLCTACIIVRMESKDKE